MNHRGATQVHRSLTWWFTRMVHSDEALPSARIGRSLAHRGRGAAARFLLQSRRTREPQPRPSALFMPIFGAAGAGGDAIRPQRPQNPQALDFSSSVADTRASGAPPPPVPPSPRGTTERVAGPAEPHCGPGFCSGGDPFEAETKKPRRLRGFQSGRRDSNSGPLVPQTSALTRLRHAPRHGDSSARLPLPWHGSATGSTSRPRSSATRS